MVKYGQYVVPSHNEMVNFGVGQPSTEMLPLNLIKKAMKDNMKITDPSLLQYGDIPGYLEFRESLANFLISEYNTYVDTNELFVTNGVTQALSLLCTLFTKTNSVVIVEEPTYFLAINIFKDFNLKIVSVKIDNDGVNLEELEDKLSEFKDEERILFYTIPAFHNPTSITMSHEKRVKLGELGNKYNNLLVIADEVYQLLYFDENKKPPMPLRYYNDNFISLGSFSKILAPSLRLGWIHASNKILDILINSGILDSSGGLNPLISSLVHSIIKNGHLYDNLVKTRKTLSDRCDILYNKISLKLGKTVKIEKPYGGYFLWLEFDKSTNCINMLKKGEAYKVKFHPGNKFSSNNTLQNCLRISFSYYSNEGMDIGASRLYDLINDYRESKSKMINVAINGSTGKLGSLIKELLNENNLNFIGGINRNGTIPDNTDVIIDVSSDIGTHELLIKLKDKKIPLVIGTTGDLPNNNIKLYSRFAPVAVISNFSEGIPFIKECITLANNNLKKWNFSILEKHHIHKIDNPSGTAKTLHKLITNKEVDIKSIREGENFGEHNIIMDSDSEHIEILHQAKTRKIFANGAIKYINWIINQKPGIYYKIKENNLKEKYDCNIEFEKYSGCGNDFVMIDINKNGKIQELSKFIKKICNRGTHIGADGVIFVDSPYNNYDIKWTYYNSDGSLAKMCGNGARCVAKYVYDNNLIKDNINMITSDGIITTATINKNNNITTSIGVPKFNNVNDNLRILIENILDKNLYKSKTIDNIYRVDILVPHLVIIIKDYDALDNLYINNLGKIINDLLDIKVNVNFVTISNDTFNIRTYERGVNSETLACGTGCCAFGYVVNQFLKKEIISIKVKSENTVKVMFKNDIIYLEGEAHKIYKGVFDITL
jgi:2-aminoadipate transaminase